MIMVKGNIEQIKKQINGYDAELIAVSKKQPDDRIEAALSAGQRVFGENRVQEAQARWAHRRPLYPDLKLHLIGPLQTNKVKDACDLFDVIHTLDREKLARKIHDYRPDMPCFIQVNTGAEPQKAGIMPDDVDNFYDFCAKLGMTIMGLMCIPPIDESPDTHFEWLANKAKDLKLKHLSMGMSDDYETALKYGATHIRVGSKIFGERKK
jgi:pyridoxal phosphate enzyme (YggS family)